MLLILERLMNRTNAECRTYGFDTVTPNELFDPIGRTSTGE